MLFLLACNEYDLSEKKDPVFLEDSTVYTEPDVVWLPASIDAGVVCGEAQDSVEVKNEGDADLSILGVSVEGWEVESLSLPLVLKPGEKQAIAVWGSGAGVLTVLTDDPDTPELTVPLTAALDQPPSLSLSAPIDGQVLDIGAISRFVAQVADDVDAPENMQASWTSDIDGVLYSGPFAADGSLEYLWDGSLHTAGLHSLTLSTEDSCGGTARITVGVCQQLGYEVDSLELETWHFEGSARYDSNNGYVELTAPITGQSGTAFQTASAVPADNVVIDFDFFVSGGSGADGISLTALDTNRMTSFVGQSGGGIGYQGLPGWSIEVDTYDNGIGNDPTSADHVSFHFDGNVYNPVAWSALPEMEDGQWHRLVAEVVAPHVRVEIDGVVYIDQDIAGNYAFPAYVGFTGATGSLTNYHLIDSLIVTEYVCGD
jgi:hypothetical protein